MKKLSGKSWADSAGDQTFESKQRQHFADALKALLRLRGWNPTDAAQHYTVSQPTMVRWLNGDFMARSSSLRQMAVDAVSNADLKRYFESLAGITVDQIMLERSKHSGTPVETEDAILKIYPDRPEVAYIAIKERLEIIYRDFRTGDKDAVERFAQIMNLVLRYKNLGRKPRADNLASGDAPRSNSGKSKSTSLHPSSN